MSNPKRKPQDLTVRDRRAMNKKIGRLETDLREIKNAVKQHGKSLDALNKVLTKLIEKLK